MNSLTLVLLTAFIVLCAAKYRGFELHECQVKGYTVKNCQRIVSNQKHYVIPSNKKFLEQSSLAGLTKLVDVIGTPGDLEEIEPGTFSNIPKLKRLWLGGNQLEDISYGVFNDLPIYYIYLSANKIKSIEDEAFGGLDNLEEVYLDKNLLEIFKPTWFTTGRSSPIRVLNVHHNKITRLDRGSFYNFPDLEHLDFSFNEISYVSADIFNKPVKLIDFDLSFNKLKTLSPATFNRVNNIDRLCISFNFLRHLEIDQFKNMHIGHISLHPNQWMCSCLKDIELKLHKKLIENTSPENLLQTKRYSSKYQSPMDVSTIFSNIPICYESWKKCISVGDNFQDDKHFKELLEKKYDEFNVKCVQNNDCGKGMCKSNYCWYPIRKAVVFSNDVYRFEWYSNINRTKSCYGKSGCK